MKPKDNVELTTTDKSFTYSLVLSFTPPVQDELTCQAAAHRLPGETLGHLGSAGQCSKKEMLMQHERINMFFIEEVLRAENFKDIYHMSN